MSGFNAIVIGCGGLGSAALCRLVPGLGAGALGIEQESGQQLLTVAGGLVIEDRQAHVGTGRAFHG